MGRELPRGNHEPKVCTYRNGECFFINFNYTDVLQCLYNIPEELVLHIHGRASKHERLIFGHGSSLWGNSSEDEEQVCFELNKYEKNPYEYIFKHDKLPIILKNIEHVHIYGFSFSSVDEDYIDWIYLHVPKQSEWEASWYSKTDKERIDIFVLNHWDLKDRINLIKLEEIAI